jgi:hypothetical protein
VQIALASALAATKGWATADVDETLAQARALAEQLDRPEYLVPLIVRQFWFHFVRTELRLARALGEQLEQIGEVRNDAAVQLRGRYAHAATRFQLGEFVAARTVLKLNGADSPTGWFSASQASREPNGLNGADTAGTVMPEPQK